MTSNQLERLLRRQGLQLARLADTIPDGADLEQVCSAAYAIVGRTQAIVAAFDVPEILAQDPHKKAVSDA